MSAENTPSNSEEPFTLAQYIAALIETLDARDPAALARMRLVVGGLRARIGLDAESCDVSFVEGRLVVQPSDEGASVDGEGATDSGTVLALLDGHLEVTDAILGGRLRVTGKAEDIAKMFIAIEILLDASPRVPELQRLAGRFRRERLGFSLRDRVSGPQTSSSPESEIALLSRLGLLPNLSNL
jgi:hypothetical protein